MTPVYFLRSIQKQTKQKSKTKEMKNKHIKSIAPPLRTSLFHKLVFHVFQVFTQTREKRQRAKQTHKLDCGRVN